MGGVFPEAEHLVGLGARTGQGLQVWQVGGDAGLGSGAKGHGGEHHGSAGAAEQRHLIAGSVVAGEAARLDGSPQQHAGGQGDVGGCTGACGEVYRLDLGCGGVVHHQRIAVGAVPQQHRCRVEQGGLGSGAQINPHDGVALADEQLRAARPLGHHLITEHPLVVGRGERGEAAVAGIQQPDRLAVVAELPRRQHRARPGEGCGGGVAELLQAQGGDAGGFAHHHLAGGGAAAHRGIVLGGDTDREAFGEGAAGAIAHVEAKAAGAGAVGVGLELQPLQIHQREDLAGLHHRAIGPHDRPKGESGNGVDRVGEGLVGFIAAATGAIAELPEAEAGARRVFVEVEVGHHAAEA